MLNNNALISIIIPVYNGANYLRESIESALTQTYRNIEVLVVNDGSNDNGLTKAIALSFGNQIKYFEKKNEGVASALNLALKNMKGEYFSWLSHDDIYYPYKIEKEIQILSQHSHSVVWSNFDVIDHTSKMIIKCDNRPIPLSNKYEILLHTRIHGCTLLIPKRAFLEVGMFDQNLKTVQDYNMWLRIAKEGYDFIHINQALIQSRKHKDQGSVTLKTIQEKEVKEFFKWALNFVKDEIMQDEALRRYVLGQIHA